MRRNKRLGMDILESRELLTVAPGLEIDAAVFTNEFESGATGNVQEFDASSVDASFADWGFCYDPINNCYFALKGELAEQFSARVISARYDL